MADTIKYQSRELNVLIWKLFFSFWFEHRVVFFQPRLCCHGMFNSCGHAFSAFLWLGCFQLLQFGGNKQPSIFIANMIRRSSRENRWIVVGCQGQAQLRLSEIILW
ncbi:hypothetical protein ACJQWK_00792 [Exserohilum turcicum]